MKLSPYEAPTLIKRVISDVIATWFQDVWEEQVELSPGSVFILVGLYYRDYAY